MTKLLKIASTKDMIQLDFGDGKNPTWAHCPSAVKSYASQNIKLGDAIDIVSEQQNDGLHVTKISKAGTAQPSQAPAPGTTTGQPAPGTTSPVTKAPKDTHTLSYPGKYRDPVTPEEATAMRRNAIMGHACQLCIGNQSQLPLQPDGLADYAIVVYRKLLAAVEEK